MKSIRVRLTISYLMLIVFTVLVLESFLIVSVRLYYYENINQLLLKHGEVSISYYDRYMPEDVKQDSGELVKAFSNNTTAQVQIIDGHGLVVQDTASVARGEMVDTPDIKDALSGYRGKWEGKNPKTGEPVIAVSYPLMSRGEVTGILRLVSSLVPANMAIKKIVLILIGFGIIVIILAAVLSVLVSGTIIRPVKDLTASAALMAEGRFDTRAHVFHDDEIGKLAGTLNYMAGEVCAHEKMKNDFISSISHELKTPLTSIKGWAVTLRSGSLEDKYEIMDGLNIIENECGRLMHMVEELLDFSRLQSGRITLKMEDISINGLLEFIIKHAEKRAERQNISLLAEDNSGGTIIMGDGDRLKQALINIMDNSFKFTESGGKIKLSANLQDKNIKVCIEDTGCGIPSDELGRVTEKFYRGSNSRGGSGIGLAICSEIVKLHGGSLNIISTIGKGTRMEMVIPL
jgi:Signal transduction histidine kinase